MPASSLFNLKLSLSKTTLDVHFYIACIRFFTSETTFRKTHFPKHGFNDSKLLDCLSQGRLHEARHLLDNIPERNRHSPLVYWTSLVTSYSRFGFVDEARALFYIMPKRSVVTYNAMLSGFLHCGRLSDARRLFEEMPVKNVISWTSMLYGLAVGGRICEAKKLFEDMPERNVVSWNAMVVGLIRNGDLENARHVFDRIPVKNVVSWNAMIAGYVENCRLEEARALFEEMKDKNVVTWTTVVAGYCREGDVEEAYHLFRRSPEKNVVSWTAMIGGFTWNGFYEEALLLFLEMMRSSDITPNVETFISLAYACAGLGLHRIGKQLHAQLIVNRLEYDDYDGRLSKSLVHMYSSFSIMKSAQYIFSKKYNGYMIQSCNCMINGYIRLGQLEKAQNLFDTIPVRDKVTWTSMIDGYFSVGDVSKACYLFYNMPEKDEIAWTAMISGHVQNECFAEATDFFSEMRAHGVSPCSATYAVLFGAAGAMAYLDQGRQLHSLLIKTLSNSDLILNNSLISMYAKCGDIHGAYKIFDSMITRDLISWNSMIMGFSHHGLAHKALEVFEAMLGSGTHPNSLTFLGILSACGHAGLVNRGWHFFNKMSDVYAIQPGLEHYISMVNLLGRAGKVKEAEEFILGLTFERNLEIWGALLGVCGFGERNIDTAKNAARQVLELDPMNAPAHVLLCKIYAASGQYMDEKNLRKEMGLKGVRKVPGCSWILLNGRLHIFLSGDKLLPQVEEMLLFLFKPNVGL